MTAGGAYLMSIRQRPFHTHTRAHLCKMGAHPTVRYQPVHTSDAATTHTCAHSCTLSAQSGGYISLKGYIPGVQGCAGT